MLGAFDEIRVRAILKAAIVPLMIAGYIVYPIWLLITDSLLTAVFTFIVIFIVPLTVWHAIDIIIPDDDLSVRVSSFAKSNRENIIYFTITFLLFWLALFPLLAAPLVPRGDEPAHVARIMYASFFLTIRNLLEPSIAGVAIIVLLTGIVVALVAVSSKPQGGALHRALSYACGRKARVILLLFAGMTLAGLTYWKSSWSVNPTLVGRFGPFQPLLFSLPHLLFGYSDTTVMAWRTLNLALFGIAALIIKLTTVDILTYLVPKNHRDDNAIRLVSYLAGWIFLLFPPTIEYSVQIYLTSGVALFFALSFFLFVRVLHAEDTAKRSAYTVALALCLGIGSLWKRVILVETGAIFLLLFVYYILRSSSTKKRDLLEPFLAGVIYACVFLPWFVVVQLGGVVKRSYIVNFEYALPPHLWDYLLRYDTQMGVTLGILAYSSIAVISILSILKKSSCTFVMMPIYGVWYLFFNLDDGWGHIVDRFFVPALSLMAISLAVMVGLILVFSSIGYRDYMQRNSKTKQEVRLSRNIEQRVVFSVLALLLLSTTLGIGVAQSAARVPSVVEDMLENRYIPYDSAAEYVHEIIGGNYSQLYSRFGPSSFSFYLNKYSNYPITDAGLGVTWSPDPENTTADAFVDYLRCLDYKVLALPTLNLICGSCLPHFIAQQLVDDPGGYGIQDMKVFSYGKNSFYVWLL